MSSLPIWVDVEKQFYLVVTYALDIVQYQQLTNVQTPASPMGWTTRQVMVAIVSTLHKEGATAVANGNFRYSGSPCHPETTPHFRRIAAINH